MAIAKQRGEYFAPSLEKEGFIHCSTIRQVLHVANAFYHDQHDLILLQIDEGKLISKVKWEPPAGLPAPGISETDQFPHIFGTINLDAVIAEFQFEPDAISGKFLLPGGLLAGDINTLT